EEHSPLLSIDQLPAESVEPVQQLLTDGTLYVSGIQHWDQWGLLKSAQIPIFDSETGRVTAMAGADIDITTIQFATHQALVVTVGAGILLMLAAGLLSLAIARRLTGPLNVIRAGALRAAAGDYTQRVEVSRPRELRELAERFSTSTATLHALVRSLNEAILTRQAVRDRTALRHRLASLAGDGAGSTGWAWGETGPAGAAPQTASGAVRREDAALAWFAAGPDDADERVARRAVLAATA